MTTKDFRESLEKRLKKTSSSEIVECIEASLRNTFAFYQSRFEEEGLKEYRLVFQNIGTRALGREDFTRKTITINTPYFGDSIHSTQWTDTLLHEIAHALTDPKFQTHGKEWKAWAKRLGAIPKACATAHHEINYEKLAAPGKWVLAEKETGKVIFVYGRRPSRKKIYNYQHFCSTYCIKQIQ